MGIRVCLARGMLAGTGRDVDVESKAYFGKGARIRLGDRSGIGYRCYLQGEITIGQNVLMAPEVVILTSSHNHARIDVPIREQGRTSKPVVIEDDVWLCTRAIVLPGVRIGRGSIVGCGAVVTRDVAAFSIVGGVPARLLGQRGTLEERRGLGVLADV